MSSENFDLEAFIRAVIIGLTVSVLASVIVSLLLSKKTDRRRWKPPLVIGTVCMAILLIIGLYYLWPSLSTVPTLDNLSQAEAENLLQNNRLLPQARPQYFSGVGAGRVIPNSQSPAAGLTVRAGTQVSFAVNVAQGNTPPDNTNQTDLGVTLFQPKSGGKVFVRAADGLYRIDVSGTSSGLSEGKYKLLLWAKPVKPPSDTPGWYLQRPPSNGIAEQVGADGAWEGMAQLGNAQWPPHDGDIIDLAVTVVDEATATNLLGAQVATHPQLVGIRRDIASNLVVKLKQ